MTRKFPPKFTNNVSKYNGHPHFAKVCKLLRTIIYARYFEALTVRLFNAMLGEFNAS